MFSCGGMRRFQHGAPGWRRWGAEAFSDARRLSLPVVVRVLLSPTGGAATAPPRSLECVAVQVGLSNTEADTQGGEAAAAAGLLCAAVFELGIAVPQRVMHSVFSAPYRAEEPVGNSRAHAIAAPPAEEWIDFLMTDGAHVIAALPSTLSASTSALLWEVADHQWQSHRAVVLYRAQHRRRQTPPVVRQLLLRGSVQMAMAQEIAHASEQRFTLALLDSSAAAVTAPLEALVEPWHYLLDVAIPVMTRRRQTSATRTRLWSLARTYFNAFAAAPPPPAPAACPADLRELIACCLAMRTAGVLRVHEMIFGDEVAAAVGVQTPLADFRLALERLEGFLPRTTRGPPSLELAALRHWSMASQAAAVILGDACCDEASEAAARVRAVDAAIRGRSSSEGRWEGGTSPVLGVMRLASVLDCGDGCGSGGSGGGVAEMVCAAIAAGAAPFESGVAAVKAQLQELHSSLGTSSDATAAASDEVSFFLSESVPLSARRVIPCCPAEPPNAAPSNLPAAASSPSLNIRCVGVPCLRDMPVAPGHYILSLAHLRHLTIWWDEHHTARAFSPQASAVLPTASAGGPLAAGGVERATRRAGDDCDVDVALAPLIAHSAATADSVGSDAGIAVTAAAGAPGEVPEEFRTLYRDFADVFSGVACAACALLLHTGCPRVVSNARQTIEHPVALSVFEPGAAVLATVLAGLVHCFILPTVAVVCTFTAADGAGDVADASAVRRECARVRAADVSRMRVALPTLRIVHIDWCVASRGSYGERATVTLDGIDLVALEGAEFVHHAASCEAARDALAAHVSAHGASGCCTLVVRERGLLAATSAGQCRSAFDSLIAHFRMSSADKM